jgi:hypothetical protein
MALGCEQRPCVRAGRFDATSIQSAMESVVKMTCSAPFFPAIFMLDIVALDCNCGPILERCSSNEPFCGGS